MAQRIQPTHRNIRTTPTSIHVNNTYPGGRVRSLEMFMDGGDLVLRVDGGREIALSTCTRLLRTMLNDNQ